MAVLIGAASVPSRGTVARALGALAALVLLLTGPGVTSARAHSALRETFPAEGSSVAAPTEVRMRFNEPVNPQVVDVVVTGADGAEHGSGPARADGDLVVQPVSALPAGGTVVAYRVVSADGHPVSGQWSFTVTAAEATPTPESSPATSPGTTAPSSDPGAGGTGSAAASEESGSDSSMVPVLISLATIPLMIVALTLLVRRVLRDSGRAGSDGTQDGSPDPAQAPGPAPRDGTTAP